MPRLFARNPSSARTCCEEMRRTLSGAGLFVLRAPQETLQLSLTISIARAPSDNTQEQIIKKAVPISSMHTPTENWFDAPACVYFLSHVLVDMPKWLLYPFPVFSSSLLRAKVRGSKHVLVIPGNTSFADGGNKLRSAANQKSTSREVRRIYNSLIFKWLIDEFLQFFHHALLDERSRRANSKNYSIFLYNLNWLKI